MRLHCPNCNAELDVHDVAISGRTRSVRCAACEHTFRPETDAEHAPARNASWEVEVSNGTLLICSSKDELAEWVERDVVSLTDRARYAMGDWETVDEALHRENMAPPFPGPAASGNFAHQGADTGIEGRGSFDRDERETMVSSPNLKNTGTSEDLEDSAYTSVHRQSAGSSLLFMVLVAICGLVVGWWMGHVGLFVPDPIVPHESWKHSPGMPPSLSGHPADPSTPNITDASDAPVPTEEDSRVLPDAPPGPTGADTIDPLDAEALADITPATTTSPEDTTPDLVAPIPEKKPEPDADADGNSPKEPEISNAKDPADPEKKHSKSESRGSDDTSEPNSYDAWMDAGNKAKREGNYEEAIHAYDNAASQSTSVEPLVRMAKVYLKQGKNQLAADTLKKALKRNASFPWIYYGLGQALERAGRSQESLRYYREYLQRFPEASLSIKAKKAVERLRR